MVKNVFVSVLILFAVLLFMVREVELKKKKIWFKSIKSGNIDAVEQLLKDGVNPNIQDNKGRTALHIAALDGNIELAKVLINWGIKLDIKDKEDHTALYYFIKKRNWEIVDRVISLMGNHIDGLSFKELAMSGKAKYVIKCAPYMKKKVLNETFWDVAYKGKREHIRVLRILLKFGANINYIKPYPFGYYHPYWGAIRNMPVLFYVRDHDIFDFLLENGANPNVRDRKGRNVFLFRMGGESGKNVERSYDKLVSAGLNIYMEDNEGKNALIYAVINGRKAILEILLREGLPVNKRDIYGNTALHYIVMRLLTNNSLVYQPSNDEDFSIMIMLLKYGASPNIGNNDGDTPVHYVAKHCTAKRSLKVMEMLVKEGGNGFIRNREGGSAVRIAYEKGCTQHFRMMVGHSFH